MINTFRCRRSTLIKASWTYSYFLLSTNIEKSIKRSEIRVLSHSRFLNPRLWNFKGDKTTTLKTEYNKKTHYLRYMVGMSIIREKKKKTKTKTKIQKKGKRKWRRCFWNSQVQNCWFLSIFITSSLCTRFNFEKLY